MPQDLEKKDETPFYEKVVIGSTLDAVLYAFNNNLPLFFTEHLRPFRFDYLEREFDLSCLRLLPETPKSLTTFGDARMVGLPKDILWERLLFLLSLNGNVPLSNLCHTLRYDGKRVVCSNEYSKIMEFEFSECVYFDDPGTLGFVEEKTLDDDMYICYDYIAFNKGGKHEIDYIKTADDFVSEIWFYSSDRIDGNTPVRDACAVSKLTANQLIDFDYSQTMARFKVIHEMESRGMKGTFAHGYTSAGNPKHYKFRTTSIRRQTHKRASHQQPQSENIKIAEDCTTRMLQNIPQACVAYDRFLRQM